MIVIMFQSTMVTASGRVKDRSSGRSLDGEESGLVSGRLSKQILSEARRQRLEEGQANEMDVDEEHARR